MIKIGDRFLFSGLLAFLYFFFLNTYPHLSWSATGAEAVSVEALVESDEVEISEVLTVQVLVSLSKDADVSEPKLPTIEGLSFVNSFQSQSQSTRLMGGPNGMEFKSEKRIDFSFQFSPQKVGAILIPPFEVMVDGLSYKTKPIKLKVFEAGSAGGQRKGSNKGQAQQGSPFQKRRNLADPFDQFGKDPFEAEGDSLSEAEELLNQMMQRRGLSNPPPAANESKAIKPNESFFIRTEVDKTEAYEGEQITANWYLFTRVNILQLDRTKFPDLKGFWKEVIEEVPALNFYSEVLNGIAYRKALLASHALFPMKPGTATIDEYKIKATVQIPTGGFGGGFGFGKTYNFTRSSDRLNIKVKAIPTEGRPSFFAGAVGQFEIQTLVEGKSFPVNQPFSLKIHFEGVGNAKSIELPTLNLPSIAELYDTKAESKYFKNGRSLKEFEVLIIPRQEGILKIPALAVAFFDPVKKQFYTKTSQEIQLEITPNTQGSLATTRRLGDSSESGQGGADGQGNSNGNVNSGAEGKSDSDLKNNQGGLFGGVNGKTKKKSLPEIIPTLNFASSGEGAFGFLRFKPWHWVFIFIGIFILSYFKARQEFSWGKKQRNIKNIIQNRYKKIPDLIAKEDWRQAGIVMTNLIYYTLGEISGQGGANLEIQKLLELAPPSVRREFGNDFKKWIEIFQVLSFAPESVVGNLKEKAVLEKNSQSAYDLLIKSISIKESKA